MPQRHDVPQLNRPFGICQLRSLTVLVTLPAIKGLQKWNFLGLYDRGDFDEDEQI